jgi:Bacterial protein of unknown function (DUF885)
MKRTLFVFVLVGAVAAAAWMWPTTLGTQPAATYDALVKLYDDMRGSQQVRSTKGVPDYSTATVQARRKALDDLGRTLDGFDSSSWPRSQRVDHLLVLAQWRNYDFEHRVLRPWARDPGLYVDALSRVPFAELPLSGQDLETFKERLQAVSAIVEQAKANLTEGVSEQTRMAIRNLELADGVGHGHPYRSPPPAGIIGWYEDLAGRISKHHPDLSADAARAKTAVEGFRDWLKQNQGRMTAKWGIGLDNYDYLQRYIRLMPYTAADNVVLADRELERSRAFLALERWKNRKLPLLAPSASADEYEKRKKEADEHIRRFIREQEILTIPDYVKELDTNVPWIVRPGGKRNFWEEIQYRDPRPDHVHAVIPGHRFDGMLHARDKRPIRGSYSDGGRTEGWGFYLEEMFLQAGLLDSRPRTKELYYLFQIKRATRNKAEVMMHDNKFTIDDAVKSMMDNVEFLDADVARVDAEIYLRRPAYGSGYQMGKLQIDQLLSDRFHQLKDKFNLKQFHDEFLAAGTIPIALIRYEMTGYEDEIAGLWKRIPDKAVKGTQ